MTKIETAMSTKRSSMRSMRSMRRISVRRKFSNKIHCDVDGAKTPQNMHSNTKKTMTPRQKLQYTKSANSLLAEEENASKANPNRLSPRKSSYHEKHEKHQKRHSHIVEPAQPFLKPRSTSFSMGPHHHHQRGLGLKDRIKNKHKKGWHPQSPPLQSVHPAKNGIGTNRFEKRRSVHYVPKSSYSLRKKRERTTSGTPSFVPIQSPPTNDCDVGTFSLK